MRNSGTTLWLCPIQLGAFMRNSGISLWPYSMQLRAFMCNFGISLQPCPMLHAASSVHCMHNFGITLWPYLMQLGAFIRNSGISLLVSFPTRTFRALQIIYISYMVWTNTRRPSFLLAMAEPALLNQAQSLKRGNCQKLPQSMRLICRVGGWEKLNRRGAMQNNNIRECKVQNAIAIANAKCECNAFLYPSPIVLLSFSSSVNPFLLGAFCLSQLGNLRPFFSAWRPPSVSFGSAFPKQHQLTSPRGLTTHQLSSLVNFAQYS